MLDKAFTPAWGKITTVANSATATAAVVLPKDCEQLVLTNTSTTAITYVMVTYYMDASDVPTGTAPTTSNGLPVLPSQQIRITVGKDFKLIRTIASAADGNIVIVPGNGG